ncbi:hypothetical protein DAPPUDRAFT_306952 [Daphnia pulex]|uniref:Chitin-binding type-4 domain-containing protein n=2 Tax=Daphnia pulex TaxID=6669 RepID=E9H0A6_DAPPU|nr:hypothetical protein DAPPUDRAFT_306952 [Daphnia pulex]|eukprot:EFX74850.1 hypothetical protein DAPPUDRAFT_306952 [Daphnia pulex]
MNLPIIALPLLAASFVFQIGQVTCHGRLMDPPSRNAMWRFGFPNPVDVKDNELWCGGQTVLWDVNGGKCGVCGDPWNETQPRAHEIGGHYANGLLGRRYTPGQVIDVEVELTSNHKGHFELRLCPLFGYQVADAETENCFNKYPLYLEGQSTYKFTIPEDSAKHAILKYRVKLPNQVTCTACVIQWVHYASHLNGTCDDGTMAIGCGNQEVYRNCADVAIITTTGGFEPFGVIPTVPTSQNVNPYALKLWNKTKNGEIKEETLVVRSQYCMAIGKYRSISYFDSWCMSNCLKYPPTCPEHACKCTSSCVPRKDLPKDEQAAEELFCQHDCMQSPFSERCSRICDCA